MNAFFSGAKVGYEKVHGRRGRKSRAWREAQLACFNQFRSLSGGFHVTSSPPCWWTVNKRSLISSLCLSTSICSFHRGYLCLPRLHENHFLAQASKLSVTLVEASSLLVKFAWILWRCAWVVKYHMLEEGYFLSYNYTDERTASQLRITEKIKAVLFKVCNIWGEYITPKVWMELQSKRFLVQTNNKGRSETKFYFVS